MCVSLCACLHSLLSQVHLAGLSGGQTRQPEEQYGRPNPSILINQGGERLACVTLFVQSSVHLCNGDIYFLNIRL